MRWCVTLTRERAPASHPSPSHHSCLHSPPPWIPCCRHVSASMSPGNGHRRQWPKLSESENYRFPFRDSNEAMAGPLYEFLNRKERIKYKKKKTHTHTLHIFCWSFDAVLLNCHYVSGTGGGGWCCHHECFCSFWESILSSTGSRGIVLKQAE